MSTHIKEKEEKITQILEWLAQESLSNIPIIVEGKKDTKTLQTLCIKGKIVEAKTGGKSILDIVSEIEKSGVKEVILLFDFDRRGKELTKKLTHYLEKIHVKSNIKFWKKLLNIVGNDVKDIEGLVSYIETLKRKSQTLK